MKLLTVIALFLFNLTITSQEMKFNIIPTLQKVEISESDNSFGLGESFKIVSDDISNLEIKKVTNFINEELKKNLSSNSNANTIAQLNLNLLKSFPADLNIPKNFEDEAYLLDISESEITLKATTPKGLFYAAQSLIQLNELSVGVLQSCKIVDWPDMKIRGISDDISRGQVSTLYNFKRIVSFISRYKMNTYMPYIEDMIEFKSYPNIGKNRGVLTHLEIKELLKYADEHFVEVIPIFQTLGHYENILCQEEFIELADFPGAASLDVTNEKTYEFLETLLKEVFELFPSKYFHMGADESYDVGFGNSKSLVEQTSLAAVHANHYKRVYDICKKYDKEVMMYGDIILSHPEILEQIPKDIIIVDWHYFPRFKYPSTKLFKEAGFNYIVSPTVWNFNAAFPENFLAVPNIETFTREGINDGSIGMINSCWGDYGAESFKELNLYGYAWSAQCSWNIEGSNSTDFTNSFFTDFYGTNYESITELYNELADPANQVLWNAFWRHPLLDYRTPDWREYKIAPASKLYWMNKNSDDKLILSAKDKISKNNESFELVEYAVRLKNYFGLKLKTQQYLFEILDSGNVDKEESITLIDENISTLTELKKDFVKYWLRTNKENNLWMIEDKFDRLITSFVDTKTQISNNNLTTPLIESKCILHSAEKDSITESAIFQYKFELDEKIESAHLQLIADGQAKLFINDKYVDQVYVKRSGSLWLEQQRVKLIDVKKYLKVGINTITVEAKNYKLKNACINLLGNIVTENGSIKILTNEEWQSRETTNDNWINAVVKIKDRSEIISPNFNTLRKSWIER